MQLYFTSNKSNFAQLFINSSNVSIIMCQMPKASLYTVFKQSVHNVSAHQLQQHTIEICCKVILPYQ